MVKTSCVFMFLRDFFSLKYKRSLDCRPLRPTCKYVIHTFIHRHRSFFLFWKTMNWLIILNSLCATALYAVFYSASHPSSWFSSMLSAVEHATTHVCTLRKCSCITLKPLLNLKFHWNRLLTLLLNETSAGRCAFGGVTTTNNWWYDDICFLSVCVRNSKVDV